MRVHKRKVCLVHRAGLLLQFKTSGFQLSGALISSVCGKQAKQNNRYARDEDYEQKWGYKMPRSVHSRIIESFVATALATSYLIRAGERNLFLAK
jgi:hypothetical protein